MLNGHGGDINKLCDKYDLNPDEIMDFSASINPLGCPESVHKVVSERFDDIRNYPDSECVNLKKTIADKISCNDSNIIVGNGSNELFYLIPRAMKPRQGILMQPTFSEFKDALANANVEVVEIVNDDGNFPLINTNLSNLRNIEDGMVFLCNPNNPTGQLTLKSDILELVKRDSNRLIVVDEAFMDFVDDDEKYSVIKEAPLIDNLIVVRSLTKFYGFPGLRLGYLVANESIVNKLIQFKEPWTVNTFAQIAGQVAIDDVEFAVKTRQYVFREKAILYDGLAGIKGIRPLQPSVNFILVKIHNAEITASGIQDLLIKDNIIIRDCSNFIGLSDKYFRVAVRTRKENQKLLSALRLVLDSMISDETDQSNYVQEFVTG
ncbi:MAG: Threonine-phosphate decarboxylase [Candidatus Scalindua arabica]|uniref:threonine-phosphate decarboxylase n=1 Tax=Candidatus Scalindua arabica TaxID=1127984 RepID=A0A941W304_9BACT|nr:Threonine-phosphate decarboxylase [Candidatus Scalindua arabica]